MEKEKLKAEQTASCADLLSKICDERVQFHSYLPKQKRELCHWSKEDWKRIPKVGEKYATRLQASVALANYLLADPPQYKESITHPQQIEDFLLAELGLKKQEHLLVIALNIRNQILAYQHLFIGGFDEAMAQPREIFHFVLQHRAKKLMLAHNHPSGSLHPSSCDIELTERITVGSELLGLELLDHFIVAYPYVYSMRAKATL